MLSRSNYRHASCVLVLRSGSAALDLSNSGAAAYFREVIGVMRSGLQMEYCPMPAATASMAEWADDTVRSAAFIALAGQSHGYTEIIAAVKMLRQAQAKLHVTIPVQNSRSAKSLRRALDRWENEGGR